ncbi:hypothetical protein AWH51_02680 [Clavibacter tessellarius]|uniref:Uncharacterized protein n=1 Tax=Clavibacter tessellarius TaxID=31965 RepID=A0A154V5F1_9MICO|nr:hypothetical protein AWH51_02680 [Clavibacter michiganensis subsp. tessellarius]
MHIQAPRARFVGYPVFSGARDGKLAEGHLGLDKIFDHAFLHIEHAVRMDVDTGELARIENLPILLEEDVRVLVIGFGAGIQVESSDALSALSIFQTKKHPTVYKTLDDVLLTHRHAITFITNKR